MKATRELLERINQVTKDIVDYAPDMYESNYDDLFYTEERIQEAIEEEENVDKTILMSFCGEQDDTHIDLDDYLKLGEEIKTIKIVDDGYITTEKKSYFIVSANDSFDDYKLSDLSNFEYKSDKLTIKLDSESYIVGLVASSKKLYHNDYWGTITPYMCVEITYQNERLENQEEIDLLNSFIFEIADNTNIALTRNKINLPPEYLYPEDEENFGEIQSLEPYNEGMKFFTSAIQINDIHLKFLNFYKVLEHFAPIAVNIEANELMRKKLDSPKKDFEDGDFIRSIYNLANAMKSKFNDEDLIKATFSSCFDFIHLFQFLPNSITAKVKKQLKISGDLEYSTNKQIIETATNMVAKIIYKTRNKVVHAKSNFEITGEEVEDSDFENLNDFMKRACSQTIRWYSRQPSHLKQKII